MQIVAHLARNTLDPLADTLSVGSFTECNFPGYVPKILDDWGVDIFEEENYAEGDHPAVEWQPEDIVEAQQVTAVYVTIQTTGGVPRLLQAEILEVPLLVYSDEQKIRRKIRAYCTTQDAA